MYEEVSQNAEIMTFKIINAEYIEDTMASGNIYIGCADYYAYQENTGNKGQGDKDEGLYARVRKENNSFITEQERLYGTDLVKIPNGDFLDLKLKSVINMPICCFYTINASDPIVSYFDEQGETPNVKYRIYTFDIPEKVLKDFSVDNFGIINFLNHTDLYVRIEKSLKAEGCRHFTKTRMRYVDRENKEWFCPENHPFELFYKDISFGYQREGRIIAHDRNVGFPYEKDAKKKVRQVNIGNLTNLVKKIKIVDIRVVIKEPREELES